MGKWILVGLVIFVCLLPSFILGWAAIEATKTYNRDVQRNEEIIRHLNQKMK